MCAFHLRGHPVVRAAVSCWDGRWPKVECSASSITRVPIPEGLRLVAYVPSEATRFSFASADKTNEMRALLPPDVPREQAVFNIQRTALLIDCLHRGDLSLLRFATEDVLHQPARATIYPHLKPMCQAAINAGAHGAFLSGAGPTILAICSGATGGDIFTNEGRAPGERRRERHAEGGRLPHEARPVEGGKFASARRATGLPRRPADPPMSSRWRRSGPWTGTLGRAARARRHGVRRRPSGQASAARASPAPTTSVCSAGVAAVL